MSKPLRDARNLKTALRFGVSVAVVGLAAGLLTGVAISTGRQIDEPDLVRLVRERQAEAAALSEQVDALQRTADDMIEASLPTASASSRRPLNSRPVAGPGLVVKLSDASPDFIADEGASANDLVVHQQDVDAVINALWRGGAEAVAVQGVRLAGDTTVRCVGNVILVGARPYAPPYRIEAIGDPATLAQALDSDTRVRQYRADAARYDMGWSVTTSANLVLAPADVQRSPSLAVPIN